MLAKKGVTQAFVYDPNIVNHNDYFISALFLFPIIDTDTHQSLFDLIAQEIVEPAFSLL